MRGHLLAAALAAGALAAAPATRADSSSLPSVASGERPGPTLLYADAPAAPQLENVAPWKAPPILVSGTEAYRDGEFLYQDFLFDDHGATGDQDPNDPFNEIENMFSPKHGTLSYPTDPAFANNGADLVELRVKPLADATAFRVTLNALKDPSRTAFTIALGDSSDPHPWPHGANVSSPAQLFLTVHGTTAELLDATSGAAVTPAPTAAVDLTRRQIDVRVPRAAWDPGPSVVRMAAGVGIWDPEANGYAQPGRVASATAPGGASPSRAALFNVAFRTDEPLPRIWDPGVANTIVEGHAGVVADGTWWRERRQGDVLASGDVSEFSARVDFAKLGAGVTDDSTVPRSGHLDRIYPSRFVFGQGADYNAKCLTASDPCSGRLVGQLQPYAVYVPAKPVPAKGFGLVISMHGLSANYNEFLGSHEAQELGERGAGSIFASPEGRGPDGKYESYAEADAFEMWADVARHYHLNPDITDVTGYSMGGGGTYRLATRWPDLWARAFPIVGPPSSAATFPSMRNIPVMAWYAQTDELVGPELSEEAFNNARTAGIRYDHWIFTPGGHITIGNNDEFAPAAAFLGDHTVDRDPAHVTYLVDPSEDPKAESPANHVYWLSGLTPRTAGQTATVDARSHASGRGDPPALPMQPSAGTLNGGSHGPVPYQRRTLAWGPAPAEAQANRLDLTVKNLAAVTVDAPRAGLGCDADVKVTTDGPVKVSVGGCDLVAQVRKGTSRVGCVSRRSFVIHVPRRVRGHTVRSARVTVDGAHPRTVRGRSLATRISLRGLPRGRFRVRIVARLSTGRRVALTRRYRTCAPKRKR